MHHKSSVSYCPKNEQELHLLALYQIPLIHCNLDKEEYYFEYNEIVRSILDRKLKDEHLDFLINDPDYKDCGFFALNQRIAVYVLSQNWMKFNRPPSEYYKTVSFGSEVKRQVGGDESIYYFNSIQQFGIDLVLNSPKVIDYRNLANPSDDE